MLSVVMLLTTLVTVAAVLADMRQSAIDHARSDMNNFSRILAEQTARTFHGVALVMRGVQERLSDDYGSNLDLASEPVHLLLRNRVAGLPQVKSIFVADSSGLGVNSSRPDFIRQLSLANRTFFRHFSEGGQDEIFISGPEQARVDGKWTYYASIRLRDAEGGFRGVLVASISIDYFESLYESIGLDFVTSIQLFNAGGTLLAGKPRLSSTIGRTAIQPDFIRQLQQLPVGSPLEVAEMLPEGNRFVAYRQIAGYPLLVGVSLSEHEALGAWHRVLRPIVAGASIVIIFLLLTSFLMVRSALRKSAFETALRAKDEYLRHMVQSVSDAIMVIGPDRRIVLFNQAAEQMFRVSAESAIRLGLDELLSRTLPPPQSRKLQRYLAEAWRASPGAGTLGVIELSRGNVAYPVELSLAAMQFHGETLLTAVFRDLTERQRFERALFESNRQLQELSELQENIREQERGRISRELHDELGQSLTGIRMEISWLGRHLDREPGELGAKILAIKSLIDETIKSVRRISSDLRPLALDDLGFAAAAGWYVDQFSARSGLNVTLTLPECDPERGGAVATALFRILQESLTNASRHANATTVRASLDFDDNEWTLTISDNGDGFETTSGKAEGIGLIGMRERVQALGGRFSLAAAPGRGCTIEAVIPKESGPLDNDEKN
jgi:PAS domain S-box-containing protein